MANIDEWEHMWTTKAHDYWLVTSESGLHTAIFEIPTNSFVRIEDNDLYRLVKQSMVEAGVKQVDMEYMNKYFESILKQSGRETDGDG